MVNVSNFEIKLKVKLTIRLACGSIEYILTGIMNNRILLHFILFCYIST